MAGGVLGASGVDIQLVDVVVGADVDDDDRRVVVGNRLSHIPGRRLSIGGTNVSPSIREKVTRRPSAVCLMRPERVL